MSHTAARWAEYVRSVIDDDKQLVVAAKTGINQTTISRWLNGDNDRRTRAETVVQLARTYDANVLEALAAAGIISDDEAGTPPPTRRVDISSVSTSMLLRELGKRTQGQVA